VLPACAQWFSFLFLFFSALVVASARLSRRPLARARLVLALD
jgi:hypothetical protein